MVMRSGGAAFIVWALWVTPAAAQMDSVPINSVQKTTSQTTPQTVSQTVVPTSGQAAGATSGPDGRDAPVEAEQGLQPSGFDRQVRGIVVSPSKTILSSQLVGRITEMPLRAGQTFAINDVLVRFDCTPFKARVAAARSSLEASKINLASAKRLLELNSGGQHDVDLAQAEVSKGQAEVAFLSHDVSNCTVNAPFSGRVVERHSSPHASVKIGDRLIEIVDDSDLEIEVLVPSIWLRNIKAGSDFDITLPAAGNMPIAAKVYRLGANVDPASQTIRVFGTFSQNPVGVLSGMGGNVVFKPRQSDQ